MLRNKSTGFSSLQHCQYLGPREMLRESANRPLVHTHNEAPFWQNIQGCQESWSRMGWASKERRDRRPPAKRISLALEKLNTEHSKWFPALSTAKFQSEPPLWYPLTSWPYGHPILQTKPFHLQYRPQHTIREINTPAPDLQGPGLALSGSIWAVWK